MPQSLLLSSLETMADLPEHHLISLCKDESWDILLPWLATLSAEEKRNFAEYQSESSDKLALHYACANNAPLVVIIALIEASRGALSRPDERGCVPLHYVCFSRHDDEVLLYVLQEYPAATAMRDTRCNRTPLLYALSNIEACPLRVGLIELLYSNDAISNPDSDGKLPLHYACIYPADAEIIASLLEAYKLSIYAVDGSGRNALHYSLGNAETSQQPEKVKLLLKSRNSKIIDGVDNEKKSPLDQLSENAMKLDPTQSAERANTCKCLIYVLKSNPTPTPKFLRTMQSFPDWLKERAVTTNEVQKLLNQKITQRVPTAILLLDFYIIVSTILCFRYLIWNYLENRCNKDEDCLSQKCFLANATVVEECQEMAREEAQSYREQGEGGVEIFPLIALFLGAAFFLVKQMTLFVSLLSTTKFENALAMWIKTSENRVELITIVLVFISIFVVRRPDTDFDIKSMANFFAATTAFFWFAIIWFLKSTYVDFAVFVGGIIHVGRNLVAFLTTTGIILIAFTQMLLTLFKVNYVCMSYFCDYTDLGLCPDVAGTCIAGLDCPPFCENWDAGFRVFTMMVGAVDETQFQDIGEARVLFVIYMMLVVIVLLNVLIAIVTDSYSYIKDQRAEIVFWCSRLDFVSAVETITIGTVAAVRGCYSNEATVRLSRRPSLIRQGSIVAFQVAHKADEFFLGGEHKLKRKAWDTLTSLLRGTHDNDEGYVEFSALESALILISRILAAFFLVPLWIILGILTAGWLWPPQIREVLFSGKYTLLDDDTGEREKIEESQKVAKLQNEVTAVRTELTKLTEIMEAFLVTQVNS